MRCHRLVFKGAGGSALSIHLENLCPIEGAEGTQPRPHPLLTHRLWSFLQLSEWWLKTAYLQYRQPLVIYSSPGVALPKQDFVDLQGQLR